jgi:hypothetical protein
VIDRDVRDPLVFGTKPEANAIAVDCGVFNS